MEIKAKMEMTMARTMLRNPNSRWWFRRVRLKMTMKITTSRMLRLNSSCKMKLTEKKKTKKCLWILISWMTQKSNFFCNTSKRNMKSILNNSPFPKNILIKLFNRKILNSLEIKFAFSNNQRTATTATKTIRAKCFRSKAASNRLKMKTTRTKDNNSPSLKYSSCCNSKKIKEEVDKNRKRSKISHQGQSHNLHLPKFNILPQRSNSNKRRRKQVHQRVRVSTLRLTRFSSSFQLVPKTWILKFSKKFWWNNKFKTTDHSLKWESLPAKNKSDHRLQKLQIATENSSNSKRLQSWAISQKEANPA